MGTRYIIFGAGAIGAAAGGFLIRAGIEVVLVARPANAEALRRGVTVKYNGGEFTFVSQAVTSAREITPGPGDIILITTKAQSTVEAVDELASVFPAGTPVVCFQNGVRNEEVAARKFRVYAALVLLSAVQVSPDLITVPRNRPNAFGCWPEGVDSLAEAICNDFQRAGIRAITSAHVMAMKWGKLIANLNNATCAVTGDFLEQAHADPVTREIMRGVWEEGVRVLDAAGIAFEPPEGEESPLDVREMVERLKAPLPERRDMSGMPESERTYPSMWQDLYLGRKSNEVELLNGEIVELGRRLSIPVPFNSTLLDVIEKMTAGGIRPGLYTPSELLSLINSRRS